MNLDDLETRLACFPRAELACTPTPIQELSRLSAYLGGPRIWIKRDDLTGLAFGGNKARQLEYVFGQALAQGADAVVAGAYTQSNWCRQIAAAANRCGLTSHLVLARGRKGTLRQGNFLLFELLEAEVEVIDTDDEGLEPFLDAKMQALRAAGRKPFKISAFSKETQSLAALGYVGAAAEILRQQSAFDGRFDCIYIAGSEMSPAGLALGAALLETSWAVTGISPVMYRTMPDRAPDIAAIANAAAERLGVPLRLRPEAIVNDLRFVGEGYGIVSDAGREAFRLAARLEGILLDPVYTAKGFAGLIHHIRSGEVSASKRILFIHTGGLPAIFAYGEELATPQALAQ